MALLLFAACAPIAAPADDASAASRLTAQPWQWVAYTSPVEEFDVETPERYQLTFGEDGIVEIVADCNRAIASYGLLDEDTGGLTIPVGPMTAAACPPDSRSDQFVALLGGAARYFFEGDKLFIDLMADGGTLAFAPGRAESDTAAPPAAAAAPPTRAPPPPDSRRDASESTCLL